jgi:uncharacterized protein (DUF58 family)
MTRAGKYFVLMTLGIGFGAINTGNNLMFLLLGMMLSLILASGILSEGVLRNVQAHRHPPDRLFAGQPASGGYTVNNPNRWPSLSIEVAEQNLIAQTGPRRGQPLGPEHIPWWKFWRSEADQPPPVARGYAARIAPRDSARLDARYTLPARGVYESPGLQLRTRFPFSLFLKTRRVSDTATLVAYPTPTDPVGWSDQLQGALGDIPAGERGEGDDFFALREYRPGEDKRLIHWKASAKRGDLVIREHEARRHHTVDITLACATGVSPDRRHHWVQRFEHGLRRLAGLLILLENRGLHVGFTTTHPDTRLRAEDSDSVDPMLEALARCELTDGRPDLPTLHTRSNASDTSQILVGLPEAVAPFAQDDAWDAILTFDATDDSSSTSSASRPPADRTPRDEAAPQPARPTADT